MKKIISKLFLVAMMLGMIAMPYVADAQLVKCGTRAQDIVSPEEAGGNYYEQQGQCKFSDLFELVFMIVNYMIGMAGLVAIFFVVWGGAQMMLSGGNPDSIKNGKATVFNAILGLVVTMLAYLIVGYVAGLVLPGAGGDPLRNLIRFINP